MLNIPNEYHPLKKVILHRPGKEIDRLTPNNLRELLFEDIPYLKRMQDEHNEFAKIMLDNGVEVLYLSNMLKDIFQVQEVLNKVITNVCKSVNQFSLIKYLTDSSLFNLDEIIEILFAGITKKELAKKTGDKIVSSQDAQDIFYINPIPNSYFMRDPAAVIGNGVASSKMHFNARMRESYLLYELFQNHNLIKTDNFLFGKNLEEDNLLSIEGGDVIILSENAIAVGCSERTRSEAIEKLAANIFKSSSSISRVYEINIPPKRTYMHLDTVFTVVDKGFVVAYANVMNDIKEAIRYEPMLVDGDKIIAKAIHDNRSFNDILKEEFGSLTVINTGNNQPGYASREQLADGTNVFAIAPGKVVTYERNTHTNQALIANGVNVLTFNGSELVRGLGGPRCMTMPIQRALNSTQ